MTSTSDLNKDLAPPVKKPLGRWPYITRSRSGSELQGSHTWDTHGVAVLRRLKLTQKLRFGAPRGYREILNCRSQILRRSPMQYVRVRRKAAGHVTWGQNLECLQDGHQSSVSAILSINAYLRQRKITKSCGRNKIREGN